MSEKTADIIWDPQAGADQMNSLDQSWDYSIELACLQSVLKGTYKGDIRESKCANIKISAEIAPTTCAMHDFEIKLSKKCKV